MYKMSQIFILDSLFSFLDYDAVLVRLILSHTKHLKNGNRYTQLSTKLESDIDRQRGGCLVGKCCVNDWELNALGPPTQN